MSIALSLAIGAVSSTPESAHADTPKTGSVYSFVLEGNPVQSIGYDNPATPQVEGSITDVGILRYLRVEYNTFFKELFFDVAYEPSPMNLLPDSLSLVLTTGQEPESQGQYANIILDGSVPGAPILTTYGYPKINEPIRDNLQHAWIYGNSLASATADRIASTHPASGQTNLIGNPLPPNPPEGPTNLPPRGLSVTPLAPGSVVGTQTFLNGGVRFTFAIETEPLLGHIPLYPGSKPWQGVSEGPKFGIWLLSVDLASITYGTVTPPPGFISQWKLNAFACHSLYQFKDLTPNQVPVDCKGVYNGTTPLAACFPEEPVEVTCDETPFRDDLFALDSGANALFENVKFAQRKISRLSRNKEYRRRLRSLRRFAAAALLTAEKEYHNAWEASWALPQTIVTCSNGLRPGCAPKSLTPIADEYTISSTNLNSINNELSRRIRATKGVPGMNDLGKAVANKAAKEYAVASDLAKTIPESTVECVEPPPVL